MHLNSCCYAFDLQSASAIWDYFLSKKWQLSNVTISVKFVAYARS